MEKYIIRVISYLENEPIRKGTGIILSPNYILTAKHILCGDTHKVIWNGSEISVDIEKQNDAAALIKINGNIELNEYPFFTVDEIFTSNTKWTACGYITDDQILHPTSGCGITVRGAVKDDADCILNNINFGRANDYKGMSGSPVICNDRIVGILQVQNYADRNLTELGMSSLALFSDIVPDKFVRDTKYQEDFGRRSKEITTGLIERNMQSKKYIPTIFVEEGYYKEHVRYFSEPDLFIKKMVEIISDIDLKPVNKYLMNNKEKKLDFADIADFSAEHSTFEICGHLVQRLDAAVKAIENAKKMPERSGLALEKRFTDREGSSYRILHVLEFIKEELCFFKYKIILITNDAGQGKTNFLCDFARNFLVKKNFYVLFYNAYDLEKPIWDTIKKQLTLDSVYSWEYVKRALSQRWERQHRAVIIIIDGLNENTTISSFGECVIKFLEEVQDLPFIKVIISTRNELFEERFGRLNSAELGDDFYRMDMKTSSDDFKYRIFRGYLNFFEIELSANGLSQQAYDILSKDVLLLRFFCEVNQGKKQIQVRNIHKYSLFKKYCEKKRDEAVGVKNNSVYGKSYGKEELFDKLMDHICKYMIENQLFFKMPRRELTEEELTLFDNVLESDVIFKQETMIVSGLIEESENVISFTFDEFRDYCITRYIVKNYYEENAFLNLWDRMHAENWTIAEGVERYSFYLAHTGSAKLLSILKKRNRYIQLYWQNVWDLEDEYITPNDVRIWRNEILSIGKNAAAVAVVLFGRRDRNYFKNANIDLLFESLDKLADNPVLFEKVIRFFFKKTQKDKYGISVSDKGAVCPCDKLISLFNKFKTEEDFLESLDLLRLSIYMIEIDRYSIAAMWRKTHCAIPEAVEEVLDRYISDAGLPQLIYCSISLIVDELIEKSEKNIRLDELRALLDIRQKKSDFNNANERFNSIWDA